MKRTRYLVTALVVLATAATAWAFYSVPGSGNANAAGTVGTMTAPTLSDPSPSGGSVSLNWTAATLPGNPSLNSQITYEVQRNRDNTGWESAVATCTGISATSCTDTVATSGSYAYRVLAKFRTWSALSTEKTTPVTVGGGTPSPATPTSVALANGGGVGNAYVNAANRASLSVQVGLPASSSSSDTVHVVITDTASHSTADRTVGASAGAGTVTVTSIDATGLDDGSLTIRATASNSSGDSDEKTGSVTKDTVKPSSEVSSVANITTGSTFTVNYTSADAAPSATLEKVDLYVDDPGSGGFALAGTDAAPSATGSFAYSGATQDGSYGFYTRATDKAGNVEDAPAGADKTATRDTKPAAPTSVALANGGGVGNAYVNAANRASLSVQVGLPASSASTNTVHVLIADGAAHVTADRTVAATNGAGSVTVTGIDASGLDDGSLTIRATSSNASGASPEKTGSVTKDTVKPSSEVSSVANITTGSTFTVNYTSADAAPSATLEKVDLYVDDPGSGGFALAGTDAAPSATGSFAYSGATQDGSYGFYTRATDKAGNVEDAQTFAEKTATRNTDPVPRGVDLQATNAGGSPGASRIRSNDTLIFTFSEAIKSTSIVSTWTNPAAPLTGQSMVVKQNSTTDRIETLGSLNIGVVELQSNFVDSDVTFGVTLALNSDRTVLTVTFGTASGGTLRNGAANAATMKWSPDSDLRDDSNQQIDTTQVDETGTLDSDF